MPATASQVTQASAPAGQDSPRRMPSPVATPFPPLKRSQTGNRCPTSTPSAATTAISGPQCAAIRTAAAPLPPSSRRVSAASGFEPVRSTLVAPILPDPISRMSPCPTSRVRISPKGIDPSRYASANAAPR